MDDRELCQEFAKRLPSEFSIFTQTADMQPGHRDFGEYAQAILITASTTSYRQTDFQSRSGGSSSMHANMASCAEGDSRLVALHAGTAARRLNEAIYGNHQALSATYGTAGTAPDRSEAMYALHEASGGKPSAEALCALFPEMEGESATLLANYVRMIAGPEGDFLQAFATQPRRMTKLVGKRGGPSGGSPTYVCINCKGPHQSRDCTAASANCTHPICVMRGAVDHLKEFCFHLHPEMIKTPFIKKRVEETLAAWKKDPNSIKKVQKRLANVISVDGQGVEVLNESDLAGSDFACYLTAIES